LTKNLNENAMLYLIANLIAYIDSVLLPIINPINLLFYGAFHKCLIIIASGLVFYADLS